MRLAAAAAAANYWLDSCSTSRFNRLATKARARTPPLPITRQSPTRIIHTYIAWQELVREQTIGPLIVVQPLAIVCLLGILYATTRDHRFLLILFGLALAALMIALHHLTRQAPDQVYALSFDGATVFCALTQSELLRLRL